MEIRQFFKKNSMQEGPLIKKMSDCDSVFLKIGFVAEEINREVDE